MRHRYEKTEIESLESQVQLARACFRTIYTIIGIVIVILMAVLVSSIYDMYKYSYRGIETVEYHDFDSLEAINKDVVAWITMDGTSVDHPVVQGVDNFEYLDKDFYGETYAGGTVFLDSGNTRDLSDKYNILHGHHMAQGAMFGTLEKYLKEDFFRNNRTGTLLTKDASYALQVVGAGTFDAYDLSIYSVSDKSRMPVELVDRCTFKRRIDFGKEDQLLALSTCSGDMSNSRIVVLCRMRLKKESNGGTDEKEKEER